MSLGFRSKLFFLILVLTVPLRLTAPYAQSAQNQAAYLDQSTFKPGRTQETILHVSQRASFSIQAESSTGCAIRLIDRMSALIGSGGSPGRQDGRIDRMLAEGDYKVVLDTDKNASGTIELRVFVFHEANPGTNLPDLPFLGPGETVQTELRDLEQRSYWFYLAEDGIQHLEIMGRNLTGASFWRDGQWVEALNPSKTRYEAEPGRPMTHLEVHHFLKAGYYLLVCYGGKDSPWSNETGAHPLYLRRGLSYLGQNGREKITVSPFGRDAFWISGKTDYIQLARNELKETSMTLRGYSLGASRFGGGTTATITTKSRDPWCVINGTAGGEKQWLVVEARPGDELELLFFTKTEGHEFSRNEIRDSPYWISSLDSVEGRNAIDVTPLLFDLDSNTALKHSLIQVGRANPLVRRINALGENTVFLQVTEGGTYRIMEEESAGARAKYRFTLFRSALRSRETPPDPQTPEKPFELTSGIYILDFRPEKPGILHFVLYREEEGSEKAGTDSAKAAKELLLKPPGEAQDSFTWSSVDMRPGRDHRIVLYLNHRSDVAGGLVIRKLPLDLSEPLPLYLDPGQSVQVPLTAERDSVLTARGTDYTLTLGNTPIAAGALLSRGLHTLTLGNKSAERRLYSLRTDARARELQGKPELKPIEDIFSFLRMGKPIYADFERNEKKQFILRVEEPALYRLETSGRLSMEMNIRTALATSLFTAKNNGTGRNALIQTYFKPGDYLVSVGVLGRSQGRAGLHLQKNPLVDSGPLPVGPVSRITVDADHALRYRLDIDDPGRYRLTTMGLNTSFEYRLEDADGWPVTNSSVGKGAITLELDRGAYVYYSLPNPIKTRRLTILERQKAVTQVSDESDLPLNRRLEQVWRETPGRLPRIYTLTLTAPIQGTFSLSKGMEARISGPGLDEPLSLRGGDPAALSLGMGSYEIGVKSIEENDRAPYILSLDTQDLIPGLSQPVRSAPALLKVSLGEDRIVDIWSFGNSDIKASLWDESGKELIAENDDAKNDWNFYISRKLPAGRYLLKTEKVGYWSGSSTVSMATRGERVLAPVTGAGRTSLPFSLTENMGRSVVRVPVATGSGSGLVQVRALAAEPVSIAVYKGNRLLAEGVDTLYIPLREASEYTFQFWHRADTPVSVSMEARLMLPPSAPEKQFVLEKEPVEIAIDTAIRLKNSSGLSFNFRRESGSMLFSQGFERACIPVDRYPLNMEQGTGWLVLDGEAGKDAVHAEPLVLQPSLAAALSLGDVPQAFLLPHAGDDTLLLEVESQGLTIGVSIGLETETVDGPVNWKAMSLSPSKTLVGITQKGRYMGKIWNTRPGQGGPDNGERVNVTLRSFPGQEPPGSGISGKEHSWSFGIDPGMARSIVLEEANQEIEVLLSQGLVACVRYSGLPAGIVSAREKNIKAGLTAPGGTLTLINTGDVEALARVEAHRLTKLTGVAESLTSVISRDQDYEGLMKKTGTLSFRIEGEQVSRSLPAALPVALPGAGSASYSLCVAGDSVKALLRGSDGYLYTGTAEIPGKPYRIFPGISGELEVSYGEGLLKVWMARGEEIDSDFIAPAALPAALQSAIDLDEGAGTRGEGTRGEGTLESEIQLWSFSLTEPGFVSIGTGERGVTALYGNRDLLRLAASGGSAGREIFHYLGPGTYRIVTRPIRNSEQRGALYLRKIYPEELDSRNQGELRILGPGERHAYRFRVKAAGKVGVGLGVESDLLSTRLFDSDFRLLGEGPLIFKDLPEGDYFLIVQSEHSTVRYRPIVLGLDGSLTDIPQEIIRHYTEEGKP